MSHDKETQQTDRIDSTTRRGVLAALGSAGVLAALGGSAQADVGDGPNADELSHLLSRFYEGPESDLPDPGVEGRRYFVTDSGGAYPQWSLLRDDGQSWSKIDLATGSVHTDEAGIDLHTAPNAELRVPDDSRTYRRNRGWSVLTASEIVSNMTMTDGSVTLDSTYQFNGRDTALFEAGADTRVLGDLNLPAIDLTDHTLSAVFYVETAGSGSFRFDVRMPDASNQILTRPSPKHAGQSLERYDFPVVDTQGTPDPTSADHINIRNDDTDTKFWMADLRAVPVDPQDNPQVVFTFDDTDDSHYTNVWPILQKYDYVGHFATITSRVDSSGSLQLSQMKEMYEDGAEFGSHTANNTNLTTVSASEIDDELRESKRWLLENGFTRGADHHTYVQGGYNREVMNIASKYYKTGIRSRDGYATSRNIINPMSMWRAGISVSESVTEAQTAIDRLVSDTHPADTLILGYHTVESGGGISPSDFETIVDYVADNQIEVVGIEDIWKQANAL